MKADKKSKKPHLKEIKVESSEILVYNERNQRNKYKQKYLGGGNHG